MVRAKTVDIDPQPISITEKSVQSSNLITNDGSGSDAKKENNNCPSLSLEQDSALPQEQSSIVDTWIPTQNPSFETLSFGDDIDNISVEDESDDTAISDRVSPIPRKTSNIHVIDEHNLLVERCLPTSGYSDDLDRANASLRIHTPQNNSLSRSNSSPFASSYPPTSTCSHPPQELQTNFLAWLSTQEPTVEICYLEETARAIDELCKIEPAQPFSDYFNNFAFTE
ncbi:unnamed protein product [Hymenolepis diminuta]|uniref:Uncharacterized protein n=1 Tax=Hymenolepis diminuta TaxID=6216 RepID=A0A0R3SDZ3_HYMDI|nr:unnamed protein product [Hymenolepis diminuta]